MASSDNLQVTRTFGVLLEYTKISFSKLYLRQILSGPGTNQSDVIEPNTATGLGKTGVNNWEIYDGAGSGAKLIAYGQGIHTHAGNWHNCFTMVFQVERFKGSTLQIAGSSFDETNEWAIVGGTGDFIMAQGVILRKELMKTNDGKTQELTIEAYCRMKVPTPKKIGQWGGGEGTLNGMAGKSRRMGSVTVSYFNVLESLSFSYADEDGQIRTAGPWGAPLVNPNYKPILTTIKFGPSEFVKGLAGTSNRSWRSICGFKIITNVATYGPFGTEPGVLSWNPTFPCQASCTSQRNQKSELIERASAIHLYTSTPPLTCDGEKSARATGRERRRAKLTYDPRGLYVDIEGSTTILE